MRFCTALALLLTLALGLPAAGQTVAVHQAAPAAPSKTTPAKATAGAIIPGSPLAALTGVGAAQPASSDANAPAPFGTTAIGTSFASGIADEATRTFDEFLSAVRQSTRLDPVVSWLHSFTYLPDRRADLGRIAIAIAMTLLPGIAFEVLLRFALGGPRAALARRATPRQADFVVDPDEQGIADAEAGETERRPRRRVTVIAWLRRLGYALVNFGLRMVPLVAFIIISQLLLSAGLIATRPAHLAVVGLINAYLFCRVLMELVLFIAAPHAASLRLATIPDGHAGWFIRRFQILLATGFFGYAIVSIAEILGLSHPGALAVLRLIALVMHIEVAIDIWQARRVVRRWIAGPPDATGPLAGLRRVLGQIWHIAALFYVLALWIALAAGVHNAFGLLLRIIVVVILAAVIGRLLWTGSSTLLERAFPDPSVSTARHPALAARARAYNPLIRGLIRVIIGLVTIVLILQGWGVNAIGWLLTDHLSRSLIGAFVDIIITIAIALTLWECANAYINGRIDRLTAKGKTRQASRLRTLLPMIKATVGVVLFIIAVYICLAKIGVNATPLFASASVLGIAIAFGSQKLVQDIITGLFLLLEDAMQVGDVITLAGMTGTVERLSIRTIRLRGGDGSINIIPFSAVTTVTNMTRDFGYAQISIEVGYEEDLDRVSAVMTDIAKTMRAEPKWGAMMRDDLQIFGLDQFGASALVITGQIRTGPGQHWAVRREFYARVKQRFAQEHIDMPYTYLPPAPPKPELPAPADGGESK
jgi:small conductance mechanosensitive channel